ncbi:hypothetical protein WJX77_003472 [Trebouxia sp. C0004]
MQGGLLRSTANLVLVCHGLVRETYEATLAGKATQMADRASEAFTAWKQAGHPGWRVGSMDSRYLAQLDLQVAF